mgnify:CR=1 FL=1
MGEGGADDEPDARALEHEVEDDEHPHRDEHHEALVGGIAGGEEGEEGKVERGGHAVLDGIAPPAHDHELLDQVGEPEGEEKLGHVAVAVHVTEPVALHARAHQAGEEGASTRAGQKPTVLPIW